MQKPIVKMESTGLWLSFEFTPVQTPVQSNPRTPDEIILLLSENPQTTMDLLAAILKKDPRTIERATKKLIDAGRLKRHGSKKDGYWEVLVP